MAFAPQFTVSARLLRELEAVADLKAKIASATVQVAWTPQLAKDSRQRGAHASTAIEGNPLTLEEVRALEGGTPLPVHTTRSQREVLNYFAGLRWVEKRARQKAEAVRRARKLARKRAQREGLIAAPKKPVTR